jgi:predicted metal-dependent enzyme (double-stranded beta helix superfamily)
MEFDLKNLSIAINEHLKSGKKLDTALDIIQGYNGNDWKNHRKFCNISFKRNLVHIDDLCDIYVICWNNNQQTPIHDHSSNGCILKILEGQINEQLFTPDVKFIKQIVNKKGDVSYIDNDIGLHKVINGNNKTVSLHVYSPPLYKGKKYTGNEYTGNGYNGNGYNYNIYNSNIYRNNGI